MHHNKIASLRKGWGLTQQELGDLLGVTRSNVSRLETASKHHTLQTALTLEALFGIRTSAIFPQHYVAAYDALLPRLADLSKSLEGRSDDASARKRALLAGFANRESSFV